MKSFLKIILVKPIYNLLMGIIVLLPGNSLGWAIIIITLVVRLALLPLSNRASKAQKKMQQIQPEIDQLRAELKDDQKQMSVELMGLYKRHGINPFSSCLPLIVQLPVLFILYYVLRLVAEGGRFDLLYSFIPRPEAINHIMFGIDLFKPDHWVLPILAGGLQFWASYQIMGRKKSKQDPEKKENDFTASFNKQMLYMFPLMTIFISRSLPAYLSFYWVVTTLFTIVQQTYVFKKMPVVVAHPTGEDRAETGSREISRTQGKKGIEVVVRKKS